MRHRRGLTFLEVVIALVLLSIFGAMVTGSLTFMNTAIERQNIRLEAHEAAHRIILQHIRNRRLLQNQPKRVLLNDRLYNFDISVSVLANEDVEGERRSRRVGRAPSDVSLEDRLSAKLEQVTVTVWREGGTPDYPDAVLVRVVNPYEGRNVRSEDIIQLIKDLISESSTR